MHSDACSMCSRPAIGFHFCSQQGPRAGTLAAKGLLAVLVHGRGRFNTRWVWPRGQIPELDERRGRESSAAGQGWPGPKWTAESRKHLAVWPARPKATTAFGSWATGSDRYGLHFCALSLQSLAFSLGLLAARAGPGSPSTGPGSREKHFVAGSPAAQHAREDEKTLALQAAEQAADIYKDL